MIIDQKDDCYTGSTYKCTVLCRLAFLCYVDVHLRKM